MADIEHKDIPAGANAAHPLGYVTGSDPGAVGASKPWVDTSGGTGSWALKVRNAADSGWETVGGGGGGGRTLIATASPSGTGTVSFTAIAGTYNCLWVVGIGSVTDATAVKDLSMHFNTDTGATQYDVNFCVNAAVSAGNISAAQPGRFPGNSSTTSVGMFETAIWDYASTVMQKIYSGTLGYMEGIVAKSGTANGRWRSTAAITRIDISTTANFTTGTKFYLYGE